MQRDPRSHKGQNGKVAVIGGSKTIHGAPIFSALAAEASGVDLIYLALPALHQEVARNFSLNFQVHPFHGDELTAKDIDTLLELLATVDCAVIGPGLARTTVALKALRELIAAAPCPLVLDASALQPWTLDAVHGKSVILTPHLGELERMGIAADALSRAAADAGITIHLKGPEDRIALPDGTVRTVEGGNAGLTVGGTGDALAGLIGGLVAQHMNAEEACTNASSIIKRAGEMLATEKGFALTTREVIAKIPQLLAEFLT